MAGKRAPSKHSRASRRATSPSINTDKSLKDVSLPTSHSNSRSTTTIQPSVLAARHAAGVTKKTNKAGGRKSRPSARARRRHEKGLEMAEAVLERTGMKIEKSVGRARVVRARRKAWDDINKIVGEELVGEAAVVGAKGEGTRAAEESEDGTDEEMRVEETDEVAAPALQNDHVGDGGEEIL